MVYRPAPANGKNETDMVIPQFSIRQILAMMSALGVFFVVASLAMRGHRWAASIVAVGVALLLAFAAYGLCFFAGWCVSLFLGRLGEQPKTGSPFAHDTLPPQIIPPEQPL
jgi:hypothetical protein